MPTIVHFEIPADDVDRAKKFYSDLFGWKMERWPGTEGKDTSTFIKNRISIHMTAFEFYCMQ